MEIEIDPAKDAVNIDLHGISLGAATVLLAGFTVERVDDRRDYRETRIIAIGEIEGREFVCVYTRRGDAYRVISLRRAKRKERDVYQQAKADRASE
ncbi:MAG TPA: BrnT family toxin [Stellaceae bacterium]|nr:BrnT family toxin [Stellaceae bacterium]